MNNGYVTFKNKVFVADESQIHERKNNKYADRIVKLENNIELLKSILKKKRKKLCYLKTNKKMSLIGIGVTITVAFLFIIGLPMFHLYMTDGVDKVVHTIIGYQKMTAALKNFMIALCGPLAAVISSFLLYKRMKYKQEIAGLEAVIEYLTSHLEESTNRLSAIKAKAQELGSYTEESQVVDLKEYNTDFQRQLEDRLAFISYLGENKEQLLRAYDSGTLDELFSNNGYSQEEQAEGRKFIITQKRKQKKH